MGLFFVVTSATATGARRFTCRRCHHSQDAEVHGIGESMMGDSDESDRRARVAARLDLGYLIALARCPACKRRNPGAFFRFWRAFILYASAWFVVGLALALCPIWPEETVLLRCLMPLVWSGTASVTVLPWMIRRKWANLDRRVRWVDEESSSGASQRLARWVAFHRR